jgi:hypothetical protein
MKKILIVALSAFLFIACEKENESPLEVDTDIIGWWLLNSIIIDDVKQELDRCQADTSLLLDADERVTNNIVNFDPQIGCFPNDGGNGWYEVSGNEVTFNYDEGNVFNETVTYTFELKDDKLYLDISNNEIYIYQRK